MAELEGQLQYQLGQMDGQLAAARVELNRLSKQNQAMRNTLKQIRLMAFVMAALLTALLVVLVALLVK